MCVVALGVDTVEPAKGVLGRWGNGSAIGLLTTKIADGDAHKRVKSPLAAERQRVRSTTLIRAG